MLYWKVEVTFWLQQTLWFSIITSWTYILHTRSVSLIRKKFIFALFFESRIFQWLDLQYKIFSWIVWNFTRCLIYDYKYTYRFVINNDSTGHVLHIFAGHLYFDKRYFWNISLNISHAVTRKHQRTMTILLKRKQK